MLWWFAEASSGWKPRRPPGRPSVHDPQTGTYPRACCPQVGAQKLPSSVFCRVLFSNLVKSLTPQSYYVTIYLIVNIMCDNDNSRKSFPPGQIQLDRFPEGNQAIDILIEKIIFWIASHIICDKKINTCVWPGFNFNFRSQQGWTIPVDQLVCDQLYCYMLSTVCIFCILQV